MNSVESSGTLAPNDPRFPTAGPGHVESWFLRANSPDHRQAIWLKATVLVPASADARAKPCARVWAVYFDSQESERAVTAEHNTVPLSEAKFTIDSQASAVVTPGASWVTSAQSPLSIQIGDCGFALSKDGSAAGSTASLGWDLRFCAPDSELAAPLSLLPYDRLITMGFPRSKPLTPYPLLRFEGEISHRGRMIDLTGWSGMQGHNWGREHAWEYVWGQSLFTDGSGAVHAMVEAFTARVRLGGRLLPAMSSMVVRRGDETFRFDGLFDFWRQDAETKDLAWALRLKGSGGQAQLIMRARPEEVACLGYEEPDGSTAYCLNSKLSHVELRVNPRNGDSFTCVSEHGGALELLSRNADNRFDVI